MLSDIRLKIYQSQLLSMADCVINLRGYQLSTALTTSELSETNLTKLYFTQENIICWEIGMLERITITNHIMSIHLDKSYIQIYCLEAPRRVSDTIKQ